MMKGYEYQSEFARKYIAQARASDVLTVLRARHIDVPDAARDRILAEKEPAQLERAITATSVADVFGEPSQTA